MNNLALVLRNQGKYEQAEEMHRQALGLWETVLGVARSRQVYIEWLEATVLSIYLPQGKSTFICTFDLPFCLRPPCGTIRGRVSLTGVYLLQVYMKVFARTKRVRTPSHIYSSSS
jgi:Tetratricopeptide repeat